MSRIVLLASLVAVARGAELSVNVYEGPTTCEDSEKVKTGDHLKMHYTGE